MHYQLQSLATSLLHLWSLMDTPLEEQQTFHNMTSKIAALESEFIELGILSIDNIVYVHLFVSDCLGSLLFHLKNILASFLFSCDFLIAG